MIATKELAPAAPGHSRNGGYSLALAVFSLTALVSTWPLARHLTTAIPSGSGPPTVALFCLFTVEWTGKALEQGASYWDAPIFHPHRGTFAWSEPQPLTSLAVWALSKVTGIVAAYNVILLFYLVAGGMAGYGLARQVTQDRAAAIWAGVWLTAGAYPIQQLGGLHLVATAFPIACLALVVSLARGFRAWAVWGVGLAYFLTLMTCAQYGLFLAVLLPCVVVPLIWRNRSWLKLATLVIAFGSGASLAMPFLLRQRNYLEEMGHLRSLVNVRGAYSPIDLIMPAEGHWLTSRILGWSEAHAGYPHDVGVVPLLFIVAAAVLGGFRFRSFGSPRARVLAALLAMSGAALMLGFGPNLGITIGGGGISPYVWLYSVVPGLSGIRTPSRFAMFVTVGVAAVGAVAFASLRERTTTPGSRLAVVMTGFVLLIAEMWAIPIALVDPQKEVRDHREVIDWLRRHGGGEAILELPMSEGDSEAELEREVQAMLRAIWHGNPIVNGYSGYFAESFRQVRSASAEDLAGRGRRYVNALGVGYVLAHNHELSSHPSDLARALSGEIVFSASRDAVIRLRRTHSVTPTRPPASAPILHAEPRQGDILRIPIELFVHDARFVVCATGQILRVAWSEIPGFVYEKDVRLRGSVLVDAGSSWLHMEVQEFPPGSTPGQAVLISEERVARAQRLKLRNLAF